MQFYGRQRGGRNEFTVRHIAIELLAGHTCLFATGGSHPNHFYVNWIKQIYRELDRSASEESIEILMLGLKVVGGKDD